MFVRVLYCIFLGILVALFVGWAMASYYPNPEWETEYPNVDQYKSEPVQPSERAGLAAMSPEERAAAQQQYETDKAAFEEWKAQNEVRQKDFKAKTEAQGRAVALISLLIAVIVTSVSLWFSGKLQVITEGLLLGGIFTLIYSIGWSFYRAPKVAVWTVGIGLVVTIVVGYMKFVRKGGTAGA